MSNYYFRFKIQWTVGNALEYMASGMTDLLICNEDITAH